VDVGNHSLDDTLGRDDAEHCRPDQEPTPVVVVLWFLVGWPCVSVNVAGARSGRLARVHGNVSTDAGQPTLRSVFATRSASSRVP
jgi:hypothetical protein